MTTTEPELRYFQHIHYCYVSAVAPKHVAAYVESPDFGEVLITPIPEIEVDEPGEYGRRWAHVDGKAIGWIGPRDTPDLWREACNTRRRSLGGAEAIARWIEAHPQPDPESVARVQAVRDALATLTDDERAEALR